MRVYADFLLTIAFGIIALLSIAPVAMAQSSAAAAAEQAAAAAGSAKQAATDASKAASSAATHAAAAASAASTASRSNWERPNTLFLYGVPAVVFFAVLISVFLINKALSSTKWSLADALSEEVEITLFEGEGDARKPVYDKEDRPRKVVDMKASTSRVIALMGMMAILMLFLGFGAFSLYSFGATGSMPDSIDRVVQLLLAGLTLFAPYVVNQFSSLFQGLTPKK